MAACCPGDARVEHGALDSPAGPKPLAPRRPAGRGKRGQLFWKDRGMGDFIGSPLFFVVGVVLLLGLVGLMIFLQKRNKDED